VDAKDVEISVVDGLLIVKGEKKEEREEKKKNYHAVERFIGNFYREVPLPPTADPDKIAATSAKTHHPMLNKWTPTIDPLPFAGATCHRTPNISNDFR